MGQPYTTGSLRARQSALGRRRLVGAALALAALLLTMAGGRPAAAQAGATTLASGQIESLSGQRWQLAWSVRGPGSADVWYADLSAGTAQAIATSPADETLPDVGDAYLIWLEPQPGGLGVLRAYNRIDGTTRTLSDRATPAVRPRLFGTTAVWADAESGNWRLYAQRLNADNSPVPIVTFARERESTPAFIASAGAIYWSTADGPERSINVTSLGDGLTVQRYPIRGRFEPIELTGRQLIWRSDGAIYSGDLGYGASRPLQIAAPDTLLFAAGNGGYAAISPRGLARIDPTTGGETILDPSVTRAAALTVAANLICWATPGGLGSAECIRDQQRLNLNLAVGRIADLGPASFQLEGTRLTWAREDAAGRSILSADVAELHQGAPGPGPDQRCFPETGHCISGVIRAYWERNGGLAVFGYPISPQYRATIEGRWSGPIQWFERDRLEDHSAEGLGVLAGRLGVEVLERQGRPWAPGPATPPAPGCRLFPETGYSVCEPFLSYWQRNGGLERFGYPVGPAQTISVPGGTGVWTGTAQYFERRRMEHHPDLAGTPYEVLLGLLGRELLGQ